MNKIIKGGVVLGFSALITKVIGAIYKVPLTNLLGPKLMGDYQTVFPVYVILLTFSSIGVPNSIAKLISEGKNPKKVVYKSIIAFFLIGIVGTISMILLSKSLAKWQNNPQIWRLYIALSPSVSLVAIISVIRGYFLGVSNQKPMAISQIIEQVIKLIFGIGLIKIFGPGDGALLAVISVTISEIFALIYLIIKLKRSHFTDYIDQEIKSDISYKQLFKTVFPVTLSAIMLPLTRLSDSFLITNLIGKYSGNAIGLYGIYTGAVETIIGVPIAICYGLSQSGIPQVSRGEKEGDSLIFYTLILSALGALATLIFGKMAVNILYYGLSVEQKSLTVRLLNYSSVNIIFLALVQTTTLILIAKNKLYFPSLSLFFGLIVKIILQVILLKNSSINIYGASFSDTGCYFVASFSNLLYIISENNKQKYLLPQKGLKV